MTRVLLFGRTNVGKSTLFNMLAGRKQALVFDEKGVTRDCLHHEVSIHGKNFTIVDTPGYFHNIEVSEHELLHEAMREGIERQIEQADLVLFVIDGLVGLTPLDETLAKNLRRYKKKVLVIVNKCESEKTAYQDAFSLGFEKVLPISALHSVGKYDLLETISNYIPSVDSDKASEDNVDSIGEEAECEKLEGKKSEENNSEDDPSVIKIAIFGRPNVGKSTLTNTLLGYQAQLVADMDGVTRDSVAYRWNYQGRDFELIDTPGIRRAKNKADVIEKQAIFSAIKTMKFAQAVILVVDATADIEFGIDRQELDLTSKVIEEGRVIVIALNKADQVNDLEGLKKSWQNYFDKRMSQSKGLSFVTISAMKNKGIDDLLAAIIDKHTKWKSRIPTSRLNDWIAYQVEKNPPPLVKGRRIKMKYMTQVRSKPPSFRIVSNFEKEVPESYRRYLVNNLLNDFDLKGVPIRIHFKAGTKNPYVKKA